MNNDEKEMMEINAEPVFIVGMNGSGTTMLLDSLGRHPDLYGFPLETRELPYIISSMSDSANLNDDKEYLDKWHEIQKITAFKLINNGKPVAVPENWKEYPRSLAAIINYFFSYFAKSEGKQRWCEKTPQHVQHIDLLLEVFPKAKFIHIIRDGRDCAASFHKRWKRRSELAIYRWKNVVQKGQKAGEKNPQAYFELKYEDITNNPEYWMKEICTFLEIPFHENVLVSRQPQSDNRGKLGGITPNSQKWKTYYSSAQLERLEKIAGDELKNLGYEVAGLQAPEDPGKFSLMYWRASDYVVMFTGELGKKVHGESTRPWQGLLSLPKIAYKQWRSNKY